jgi:hypothetical protein
MPLLNLEPQRPGNLGGTLQTLIHDPQLRLQIHAQKQTKVLQWLKTEIYSSPEVLTLVLGLGHRQSLHKVLMAMQEQGLIRQSKVPVVGGHQTLWGITEHGQAMAYDPSKNEIPSCKVFEPGRISALRLKHILGLQKMKWQAIQASWSGWKNCDRGVKPQRKTEKLRHRPDVLVIDPAGRVVAVELELTFKTVKRYAEEVIQSHARQIYVEQKYQHVLWVCPTAEDMQRMKNLIRQATELLRARQGAAMKQLDAYKERSGVTNVFRLGTVDNWTQQWQGSEEQRAGNLRNFLWGHFQVATESHKDLDSQTQEERAWMPANDHTLILEVLADYKHALSKKQQDEEARRMQEQQEQQRRAEEANRRYAADLAARAEAKRRANSLIGKVGKLFNQ